MAGPIHAKGLGTINTQACAHTHTHTHRGRFSSSSFFHDVFPMTPAHLDPPSLNLPHDLPSWFPGLSTPRTRSLSPCGAFRIRRDTGTRMDDLARKSCNGDS